MCLPSFCSFPVLSGSLKRTKVSNASGFSFSLQAYVLTMHKNGCETCIYNFQSNSFPFFKQPMLCHAPHLPPLHKECIMLEVTTDRPVLSISAFLYGSDMLRRVTQASVCSLSCKFQYLRCWMAAVVTAGHIQRNCVLSRCPMLLPSGQGRAESARLS